MPPPLCWRMPYTVDRPSPVPWPARLGREERLEDARARRFVHANAGIDWRRCARTGPAGSCRRSASAGDRSTACVDEAQVPAHRHGVARVHREVHHDLLELARIHFDASDCPGAVGFELHVLAEQLAQQRHHAVHRFRRIDEARRQHLLAAEGEQLTREARGALRGLLDLIELEADVAAPRRGDRSPAR